MTANTVRLTLVLVILSLLAACSAETPAPAGPAPAAATRTLATTSTLAPTDLPTHTATPAPTETLRPTATLAPSSTPLPSPTPTPHPMSIQALRQGSYLGSPITIEQELEPGSNYRRYYASYLSEGLKIYALLTVPNDPMPEGGYPAIVFNHGYIPPRQYVTTERYIAYVDWLARSGYIVFRIDYRGHDRSEGEATGAYGSPGYAIDVLNAVASLKQFPEANPQKIGMWGHSMGGYLTLRAMVVSPDIKAGVIWAGVVVSYPDLITKWRRTSSGPTPTPPPGSTSWRRGWVEQYGSPEENPEFWNSVSTNSYLQDLSGPVQLHHSTTDETVPYEFSQILDAELTAAGQEHEFYTYEGDNHNLSASFAAAITRTIEFFDRYLK